VPPGRLVLGVGGAVLVAAVLGALLLARSPTNDRAWALDHAELPTITVTAHAVTLEGVRDFRYGPGLTPVEGYRTETYDLASVRRVWFVLAPFANRYRGLAHSFLTFEFEGDRFLAVSIEARREDDEGYSLVGGLLRGFEITYVIGTEEDLLGLRAQRGDTLFLYPSVASPDQARTLFVDMVRRAKAVQEAPEFYHTLFNNCNTNLRDHVNRATTAQLPWGWGVLLPGFSDGLALDQGLLDTELDLEAARERFRVDHRAREALADGAGDFSRRIRGAGGTD
jgi:hypothetical protein